jgi:hypothetical protein
MVISIRSVVVTQECRTFVIKPNGKKELQNGCHDDCVIGLGLTAIGMRTMPKKPIDPYAPTKKIGPVFYGRKKRNDEDDDDD